MEKKNTGVVIIIVILILLVVGLSGYIIYDKVLSKENENTMVDNNNQNESDNKIDINITWYDYLTSQEFVSASLKICSIDEKYVHEKDDETQPNPGVSRNITEGELNTILNTIYKSERENNYSEVVKTGGYPEPACVDKVVYKYMRNGKEYEFILTDATYIASEDEEFIKILDNNVNSYQYYALNHNNDNYDDLTENMMRDYVDYY